MKSRRGFDAIVGNPPFLGGTLIGSRLGLAYHDLLTTSFDGGTGLTDLIAFFLRRAFALLRPGGSFGLLATNTVAQGDTRATGLERILGRGGVIYEAKRRYRWPGDAAVVLSVIHVAKELSPSWCHLDGVSVSRISSYLLKGSADATPISLRENYRLATVGSKVWGAGFIFEEAPSGGSSSFAEMYRVIAAEPSSREVIFAYMGGEEFNSSPTQSPSRFVIDFGEQTEAEARRWRAVFAIVEERVKPVRIINEQRNRRENWWLHVTRAPEAMAYLRQHGRILALAKVSKHLSTAFVRSGTIFSDRMMLVLAHTYAQFGVVQSRIHEAWSRFVGTTMKDDFSYTTECYETFPAPRSTPNAPVETVSGEYYEFRAALMVKNNEGLTRTYNRFHDPEERSQDIIRLRELHAQMDLAVLDAYGWTDIKPAYDFREQLDESTRLTWGEDTRDDVLARLLELNRVRADEEAKSAPKPKPTKGTAKKKGKKDEASANLFGDDD